LIYLKCASAGLLAAARGVALRAAFMASLVPFVILCYFWIPANGGGATFINGFEANVTPWLRLFVAFLVTAVFGVQVRRLSRQRQRV
jgi:hypothetical protein